jgi:predicted Zn finger-like uncharacterized protein
MIITCEECTTRFTLEDARLPDTGAKVRCSKCRHAFFVKPQSDAGDTIETMVDQILTLETRLGSAVDAAADAVEGLLGGGNDSDDPEELLGAGAGSVERGVDALLDADNAAPGIDSDAGSGPYGGEPAVATGPTVQDPVAATLDGLGLRSEADSPLAGTEAAASSRAGQGEPGATTDSMVIGRIGVSSPDARRAPRVQVDVEPADASIWGRRAAHGIGWAAVWVLSALILHQTLWIAPRLAPVDPTSQELAGLRASAVEGRWVENTAGSTLYVITGELASAAVAQTPGSRLAVRLLDATGAPLLDEAADVGPEPPMKALREQSPAALRASQTQAARALARRPFFPEKTFRFAAVLDGVPPDAQRFELMTVPMERPNRRPSAAVEASEAEW